MPSSVAAGFFRNALTVGKTLTFRTGAAIAGNPIFSGTPRITPKANPATCAVGDINVQVTTNKLYVCTAANTWTVVGTQT